MTESLKCRECGTAGIIVRDSRVTHFDGHQVVRRRRSCRKCGHRWLSYEVPAEILEGVTARHDRALLDRARNGLRRLMASIDGGGSLEEEAV